jgi:hypothetical protein
MSPEHCVECGRTLFEDDPFERTSSGPMCATCCEVLPVVAERVEPSLVRRYKSVRSAEQGRLSAYQRGQSQSPDHKSLAPVSGPAERFEPKRAAA